MNQTAARRIAFSFLIFSCQPLFSQDSSLAVQHSALVNQYTSTLQLDSRIYNGPEYNDFSGTVRLGHPYFDSGKYEPGSIFFENVEYRGLNVRLDLVNEILTILHPISFISVQMRNAPVDYFTIADHEFVHLRPDSINAQIIRPGFYERIYKGKTQVFVRRKKQLEERNKGEEIFKEAVEYETYFIWKDGKYFPVKSSKSLFAVFGGRGKEVQQHLRKSKIRFKRSKKPALIEAASYFDQITS